MIPEDSMAMQSEKKSQVSVHFEVINQRLLDLEVDLQVLRKELTRLDSFSGRIGNGLRDLRLSLSEQELLD